MVTLKIPAESLANVVGKLRTLAVDKICPYQVEIYAILQKYGPYVRIQAKKKKYEQLNIWVTTHEVSEYSAYFRIIKGKATQG